MKHIIMTVILLFALGFLIITTPLINFFIDKELDNGDSVRALAKDVASNASCDLDIFGGLIESSGKDTLHEFMCDNKNKNLHFSIYIFKTQAEKNLFLTDETKRNAYTPCFKQGKYFVVCENANWYTNTNIEKPHFNGEPYYHEFKGEDMDWKIPSTSL